MRRLILRNFQSPGDILMLTAALRDLHRCHPDQFQTDVRSSCPDFWLNNPWLTPLDEEADDVEVIDCQYPLIHRSNQEPWHFIHAFMHDLSDKLGVRITPTAFRGDLHLSDEEEAAPGPLADEFPPELPWWLIDAGGKYDYTIKWWSRRRYQEVVDRLQGRVHFVQIGETGHYHPPLRGVTDLRSRTTLRDLMRLTYHSHGVLCGVTLLMHLGAAFPPPADRWSRGGVIIAGGREPVHWEAYPGHQFLHTIGMLPCCATGGCWRSRTVPLGDGEPHDEEKHLCKDVVGGLPHCMEMISANEVVSQIERWLPGED